MSALSELRERIDRARGEAWLLRKAIEAGDPKKELLLRINDLLRALESQEQDGG